MAWPALELQDCIAQMKVCKHLFSTFLLIVTHGLLFEHGLLFFQLSQSMGLVISKHGLLFIHGLLTTCRNTVKVAAVSIIE